MASIQIFRDVEEALSREVRRITFDDQRSITRAVLQDVFDPFTGELIQVPIEPSFYDSSADANYIQYPQFFIRLLKTREDRFTKRVVSQYGNTITCPITSSPKAFEIVLGGSDGTISVAGNIFETSAFNIRKVLPGYLLRILNGNNIGTYIISSITVSNSGLHTITLSGDLVTNLPTLIFSAGTRLIVFNSPVDLNTVAAGDQFRDSLGTTFPITAKDIAQNSITIGGIGTPNLAIGGKIQRTGNILQNVDASLVRFIIMDSSIPVLASGLDGSSEANSLVSAINAPIPIDAFYLIRIDSKERDTHIDVINRIWEEFNPPRTGLPIISRSNLSAEEFLTVDIPSGGSQTISIEDSSKYNIGETVFIIDDFNPTRNSEGNFSNPFKSKIIDIPTATEIKLADTVPDSFMTNNKSKVISNADFYIYMFHFVDHNTKDNEGAQYWVHEFTFWVQIWVDRFGLPKNYGVIHDIATPTGVIDGTVDGNIIIDDP